MLMLMLCEVEGISKPAPLTSTLMYVKYSGLTKSITPKQRRAEETPGQGAGRREQAVRRVKARANGREGGKV